MTFCVAVKVHDCLVFAADSATSVSGIDPSGNSVVTNVWQHGVKVFNLRKGLPIMAMTCGMANFGQASISNLAKDIRVLLTKEDSDKYLNPENYTIEQIADVAHEFFKEQYEALTPKPANPHGFEFWVGGYGSGSDQSECWKVSISNGVVHPPSRNLPPELSGTLSWAGQPSAINRLLIGYDPQVLEILKEHGLPQEQVDALSVTLRERVSTPLVDAAMPVIDAIQLADFLVDVTKRYFAFKPGADIVGGDTEIATVTKHEGFKWIKRKHFYPQGLNPVGTDHVC